jgi:hypothetical protein
MIPKDIIFKIVEAGTWAPSGDNCQPWHFKWDGKRLCLFNVPERAFRLLGNWGLVSFLNIFGLSRIIPFQSYKLCLGSSAMGLIQMPGTTPEDFVLGGRLLQRVWLTATKHGIAFHPMTGVTFLIQRLYIDGGAGFSKAHKKLLEKAWGYLQSVFPVDKSKGMIMLFRVGYAPMLLARAPRRTVKQVFDIDE